MGPSPNLPIPTVTGTSFINLASSFSMLQKGFPVVSAEGAMVWGSLPPSSRWGLVLTCAPWASPLSSCLPPHISLASHLCVSPPRGRGGSRTSSGSFRERWARVPAQLQPLREEQGGAAGGHAQPPSDTPLRRRLCSLPTTLQVEVGDEGDLSCVWGDT